LYVPNHEHFEELCARAAFGDASAGELAELRDHLDNCTPCSVVALEFGQMADQIVPRTVAEAANGSDEEMAVAAKSSFYHVARCQGIRLSDPRAVELNKPTASRRLLIVAGTIAGLLASTALVTNYELTHWQVFNGSGRSSAVSLPKPASSSDTASDAQLLQLQSQVRSLRGELERNKTIQSDERKYAAANEKAEQESQLRIAALETENADLQKQIRNREAQASELQRRLEDSQASSAVVADLGKKEEEQLRKEIEKLNDDLQNGVLNRAEQPADLLAARNLHIVDVHDTDEQGQGQRAFGRIFYIEGKQLVFYAYDLGNNATSQKDFYVWGERLGYAQSTKRLGLLGADDIGAGRWMLTITDPKLLARIDSVFVTIESGKKLLTKPTGRKVLYAYLGNKPNHP
jgi:hypothetical protein